MNSAKCGLRCDTGKAAESPAPEGTESVFVLIRVSFRSFRRGFVDHRFADPVLLARPVAEVKKPAALAAKREVRMRFRIGRLATDRAVPLHVPRILPNQREVRIGKGLLASGTDAWAVVRKLYAGAANSMARPIKSYSFASVISTVASVPGAGKSAASLPAALRIR